MLEVIIGGEITQLGVKPGVGGDDGWQDTLQNNQWVRLRKTRMCKNRCTETCEIGHRRRDYHIIKQSAGRGTRLVIIGEANLKCLIPHRSS